MERAPGQAFTGQFDAATTRILPSSRVTHVHLLRHGEVRALTDRVIRGQMDVPLSRRGEAENEELARFLAAHEPPPDAVYTSDLSRCDALASLVGRATGKTPVRDARLREQSMGSWEGRTWAEVTAADPRAVTAYWDDYQRTRPTGGESFAELEARVRAAWDEILARHAGQRIVLVTHVGPIRAILCRLLGVSGAEALRFAPATASHTSVAIGDAGAVVQQFGERPWLDALAAAKSTESTLVERPLRIALSGSAGTGKTTLGKRLAEALGLPFQGELMRARLEAGFDPHGMGPDGWRAFMRDQWDEQRAREEAARDGFVADRSSLDYAAFFLHYDLHVGFDAEPWMSAMFEEARRYDRILLFPWGALPLVADGVRSTNVWTQLRFQSILEGLVERCPRARVLRVPPTSDLEARLGHVLRDLRDATRACRGA